jgi:predicted dehydrogenase
MSDKQIRVGIVGANAKSSWARVSHTPAINGLPSLKLAAVATRNEQSAREAAEAFGAGASSLAIPSKTAVMNACISL